MSYRWRRWRALHAVGESACTTNSRYRRLGFGGTCRRHCTWCANFATPGFLTRHWRVRFIATRRSTTVLGVAPAASIAKIARSISICRRIQTTSQDFARSGASADLHSIWGSAFTRRKRFTSTLQDSALGAAIIIAARRCASARGPCRSDGSRDKLKEGICRSGGSREMPPKDLTSHSAVENLQFIAASVAPTRSLLGVGPAEVRCSCAQRFGSANSGSCGLPLYRISKCSMSRETPLRPISAICSPTFTRWPSLTSRERLWP